MSDTPPRVSTILPTYNAAEYLESALRSVQNQTFTDHEVVVVDDGSTDGTLEIVQGFDDVRLIQRHSETGIASALNRGISEARGEYIARLDADDWSHPRRLARQVDFLDEYPSIALVGTGARLVDEEGSRVGRRRVLEYPSEADLVASNHFVHGSVMMRRSRVEDVDGYDERFESSEDYDLFLRLAAEFGVANIDDPLYTLRIHSDSIYGEHLRVTKIYQYLAVLRARGAAPDFEEMDIDELQETIHERLSRSERLNYHVRFARDALWYGNVELGREQCRKALAVSRRHPMPYLLYVLSFGTSRTTSLASRAYRTLVVNPRLALKNGACERP